MSLIYYNEINFSKDFLNEYNKYCYDNFIDFNLFFLDYIKLFTHNNYYNSKFIGSKINYSELASIVLYHHINYYY